MFNALTGLNQKVGNFPGVTVDKKTGNATLADGQQVQIMDLPGTYSLYPRSADEQVTCEVLLNHQGQDLPQLIVVVADASNMKRNLLFCSQIIDLKIPVVIVLTMMDIARKRGIAVDVAGLERMMGVPVVPVNPRKNKGMVQLKKTLAERLYAPHNPLPDFIDMQALAGNWLPDAKKITGLQSSYAVLHVACSFAELRYLNAASRIQIGALLGEAGFQKAKVQAEEILQRYKRIDTIMQQCVAADNPVKRLVASERIDKVLLHPLWGNLVLLTVLFLLFQSIFWLATYPMGWIEQGFAAISNMLLGVLPHGLPTDLLVNGIIAGIGGVAIFVPQIMILFGLITILEDSGYMARISFLTDRVMRTAGLNGRSVMPLISGMACAVPAIMAARTIQNKKERLVTILITPLMSCSARLPVYTMLIALVIPDHSFLGFFNLQGLVLMGLYLLGFAMALAVAKVMDLIIKNKERTLFLMELPAYRPPRWGNVGTTMLEKGWIFIRDVGKVIMVLSVLLWALASFGPPARMAAVDAQYAALVAAQPNQTDSLNRERATARLEQSFAGILGHAIEPIIRPLGYDWKIGIALVTSFAAREVFVGTMATLYSVGDPEAGKTALQEKMRTARHPDGSKVYTLATGLSLIIFYAFAMQCMSTLAIVKRETRSWKYPAIQFAYMGALAYLGALVVYWLFR